MQTAMELNAEDDESYSTVWMREPFGTPVMGAAGDHLARADVVRQESCVK